MPVMVSRNEQNNHINSFTACADASDQEVLCQILNQSFTKN
jgi:hypothetical protein